MKQPKITIVVVDANCYRLTMTDGTHIECVALDFDTLDGAVAEVKRRLAAPDTFRFNKRTDQH